MGAIQDQQSDFFGRIQGPASGSKRQHPPSRPNYSPSMSDPRNNKNYRFDPARGEQEAMRPEHSGERARSVERASATPKK